MNPGDIIIFRGDLIHAGSEYDYDDNLRIHCYYDTKIPIKHNKTYLINDKIPWFRKILNR